MPPFDLWLTGREDIFTWWFGPGHRVRRLARHPRAGGQRLARVRPVQAEPDGRRLRAVGAAGDRALRREGRRDDVLPRHRDGLPALRAAAPPRRLGRTSRPGFGRGVVIGGLDARSLGSLSGLRVAAGRAHRAARRPRRPIPPEASRDLRPPRRARIRAQDEGQPAEREQLLELARRAADARRATAAGAPRAGAARAPRRRAHRARGRLRRRRSRSGAARSSTHQTAQARKTHREIRARESPAPPMSSQMRAGQTREPPIRRGALMALDAKTRWYALISPVRGHLDDRPRLDDRERRAAVDPRRPALLRDLARVGRERLPADVRRLPAAGRPARRPLRPPPALPRRHRALHARVARLRPLDLAGDADHRALRAGPRRRSRLRGVAVADHEPLHRARRPRQGDGRVRLRGLRRRLDRRAARRLADRDQLALDLPRQHPDRLRRRVRGAAAAARRRGGTTPAASSTSAAR